MTSLPGRKQTKKAECVATQYASAPCKLTISSHLFATHQLAVLFEHNNIFVFVRQVAPVLACWLFKTAATS